MKLFQYSLVTLIVLSKGVSLWKLADLKSKLSIIWNLKDWRLISLGRGYF